MNQTVFPKRVLHVVSAMNRGGAETLVMNIYRNIDRKKIQFDFISHGNQECDFENEIKTLGGRLFKIPSIGQIGPFNYVKCVREILKTNGPYVAVHAHTDFQCGIVAIAAKLEGIEKRICHSHNNDWTLGSGIKSKLTLTMLKKIIGLFGTEYCACSTDASNFLFGRNKTKNMKVQLLKNGIDVSQFQNLGNDCQKNIKRELNIQKNTKILGHIGRFYEQKNHKFLLGILKKMKEQDQDFVAIFVGDGPLRKSIEKEVRLLGLINNIRFLGVREDIPKLMRSFDVFVFPSLFEGFGIVMVEAQAAGTPCIASDAVPRDSDMGLGLVSYLSLDENPEVWYYEINKTLMGKHQRSNLTIDAISKRGFDIKSNVSQWLKLYEMNN